MSFKLFINEVKGKIEERLKDSEEVLLNEVMKNNGCNLTGIAIASNDNNIAPTIYLNNYYEQFTSGAYSMEEIVDDIFRVHEEHMLESSFDVDTIMNFENIKSELVFKLINIELNKEFLKNVPFVQVNDLAMIFQIIVHHEKFDLATITVNNSFLEIWDVTVDQLKDISLENSIVKRPPSIQSMGDILTEFSGMDIPGPIDMWVISNQDMTNGASVIMYENLLNDLSELMKANLYLIPSSIHEWIVIPDNGNTNLAEELKDMIKDVNDTHVQPEDILSYNLYYFNNDTEEFIIK